MKEYSCDSRVKEKYKCLIVEKRKKSLFLENVEKMLEGRERLWDCRSGNLNLNIYESNTGRGKVYTLPLTLNIKTNCAQSYSNNTIQVESPCSIGVRFY